MLAHADVQAQQATQQETKHKHSVQTVLLTIQVC